MMLVKRESKRWMRKQMYDHKYCLILTLNATERRLLGGTNEGISITTRESEIDKKIGGLRYYST